jgi:hypothetical protein
MESSKNTPTNMEATTNLSQMEMLKDILLGDELKQKEAELKELERQLAITKAYFEERILSLESKFNTTLNDIKSKSAEDIEAIGDKFDKQNKDLRTEIINSNYILGKIFTKVGEKMIEHTDKLAQKD